MKKDPFQAKSIAPNLYNHPIRSKTSQILPLLVSLKIKLSFFYVTIEASASSHQALLNIAFILQVFLPSYFFVSCYKKGYKNRTKCTSGHVHASCKTWSVFLCLFFLEACASFPLLVKRKEMCAQGIKCTIKKDKSTDTYLVVHRILRIYSIVFSHKKILYLRLGAFFFRKYCRRNQTD